MIYKIFDINAKKWNLLEKIKTKSRVPNALLFHGPEGIGKEAHAIEFASFLNCTNTENKHACGTCISCKKIKHNNHEYINYIFPLPKGKITSKNDDIHKAFNEKTLASYNKEIKLKLKNPYHKIHIDGANTILINSIRSIKKKLYQTITQNNYQIILIFEAEKLCTPNQEAANSLLKILEEPPENTIFILVTSKVELLLDTIKSRCIDLYFNQSQKKESNDDYKRINLHHILNGNINSINQLDDIAIDKIDNFLKLYNNCLKYSEKTTVIKLISSLDKLSKSDKSLFLIYITLLKHYYRDLAMSKMNPNSEQLNFLFLKNDYITINKKSMQNWSNCINSINEFEENLGINLNLTLSLFNLFNKIGLKNKS